MNSRRIIMMSVMGLGLIAAWAAAKQAPTPPPILYQDEDGVKQKLYAESHALLIGVSDYANGWGNLPGVKTDIEEVRKVLEEHDFAVHVVTNPTGSRLRQEFLDFINFYGQNFDNRLIFYFAGHGTTLTFPDGRVMGYIVPSDAPKPEQNRPRFLETAIDMKQIETYAFQVASKHALFLLDNCKSGSVFYTPTIRSEPIKLILYNAAKPVRLVITSGGGDENVSDYSIFRQQFVAALRGEADFNGDGYLTGNELGPFLADTVKAFTNDSQTPQFGKIRSPELEKGDFVFVLPNRENPPEFSPSPKPTPTRSNGITCWENTTSGATCMENMTGIEFVYVPEGCFQMGSPKNEDGRKPDEWPLHEVCLKGFWMGRYEVSQPEWEVVMGKNPSFFKNDKNRPVEQVSWIEIENFIKNANALVKSKPKSKGVEEKNTSLQFRLPSEAEWEYACRARSQTVYSFGDDPNQLSEYAWYSGNSNGATHPVGQKQSNAFGLFDMHGNVWEWVADTYHHNYSEIPNENTMKVLRGGAFGGNPDGLRCANRHSSQPHVSSNVAGFRVVVSKTQ